MNELKSKLCLVLVLLIVFGCRTEDESPFIELKEPGVRYVSADEIPGIVEQVNQKLNFRAGTINSANQVTTSIGTIDLEYIMEVLDTADNTNYSFRLDDGDDNPLTFSNLIVKKEADGIIQTPYLMEYEVDSAHFWNAYLKQSNVFENYTGVMRKVNLDQNLFNTQNAANLNGVRSNSSACDDDGDIDVRFGDGNIDGSYGNGGGTGSGPSDGGGGSSSLGGGTVWECTIHLRVVACPVGSDNPHGPEPCGANTGTRTVVEINCGGGRSNNSSDNTGCGGVATGEVGINIDFDSRELTPEEAAWWRNRIKKAIAEGITSIAEVAHELYVHLDFLFGSPRYVNKANAIVALVKDVVEDYADMNVETMDWKDLVLIWLFELGDFQDDKINFTDGDFTVEDLKKQDGVMDATEKALEEVGQGDYQAKSYQWVYRQDEFYQGVSEANYATSFLGTYTVRVTKTDLGRSVKLDYEVVNTAHWESATRLRQNSQNQNIGIIPDKARGEGIHLGGNLMQTYRWSQTIPKN